MEAPLMAHSYFQSIMHIVFSTKHRGKTIPKAMKERLWAYTAAICQKRKIFVHAIGGTEDHIHLLLQFPSMLLVPKAINAIKVNSSGWMSDFSSSFAWQEGYGAFSVSKSSVPKVVRYIQDQERRHKKMTFEHEFIAMLENHGVPYDPKYVFD
jgi:putative transposase